MQHLLALYTVLATCYFGWAVGRLFTWKKTTSLAEQLFLSISLGTLLYTLSLLLVHLTFGVAISLSTVLMLLTIEVVISVVVLALCKLTLYPSLIPSYKSVKSRSSIEKILFSLLAIIILSTLAQNLFWPVTDWDALALYDFRARVVAETGSFAKGVELGYFFQYPPFTSLLHTTIYVTGAVYAKVWYSLLYMALIAGIYAILRKRTSRSVALVGGLLIAVNPLLFEHATMAYTNLSYTLFLAMGTIYLWEWFRTKQWYCGIVGGLLIAGATWVRMTEPLWVIGVGLVVLVSFLLVILQKNWQPLVVGLLSLSSIFYVKQLWPSFSNVVHQKVALAAGTLTTATANPTPSATLNHSVFTNALNTVIGLTGYLRIFSEQSPALLLSRAGSVANYLQVYVISIVLVYLLPALVIAVLVIRKRSYRWLEWGTLLAYMGLICLGTYLFSFFDASWDQIGGSAQRMSMFLIPLLIFLILEHPLWQGKNK